MVYGKSFSSGPTAKTKDWSLELFNNALLGRSHRSKAGLLKIRELVFLIRSLLKLPKDGFYIGLVPGSATGAMELTLWNLVGYTPVNVINFDVFGEAWLHDIKNELRVEIFSELNFKFGDGPSSEQLQRLNFNNDTVLCWTGTTSGVMIPDDLWIPFDRKGLIIVDASSSICAVDYDWRKIDVAAFPFQKIFGCEAGLGCVVFSEKAMMRLMEYDPKRAIPRLFRIKHSGSINTGFFNGMTLNTPSMLLIEENLMVLRNIINDGGIDRIINKCSTNSLAVYNWVLQSEYFDFLCKDKSKRSNVNTCIVLRENNSWENLKKITSYLEMNDLAYDILGHGLGNPCIRIWHAYNINLEDLNILFKRIDEAYKFFFNQM